MIPLFGLSSQPKASSDLKRVNSKDIYSLMVYDQNNVFSKTLFIYDIMSLC